MSKLGESGFQKFVEKTLAKFTSKTKQFNTGTERDDGQQLQTGGGRQFVRCGFEPKIIKLYHNGGTSTYDPDEYHVKHYECLIIWWENGELIYSDSIGTFSNEIETTSDGFYFDDAGAAINFKLRWEAYA